MAGLSDAIFPPAGALCTASGVTCRRTLPGGTPLTVFENVSLVASPRSIVCVSGRSGSGKTTLLNLLSGLLRPTTGRVYWGERDVWSLTEDERAAGRREQLAVVLQDGGLIEWLTAKENVLIAATGPRRDGSGSAEEVLARVGLAGRGRSYPDELSMGERERVAIARALVCNPKLVILDEPTAALDGATADSILRLLSALVVESGVSLVIASHDSAVLKRADVEVRLPG